MVFQCKKVFFKCIYYIFEKVNSNSITWDMWLCVGINKTWIWLLTGEYSCATTNGKHTVYYYIKNTLLHILQTKYSFLKAYGQLVHSKAGYETKYLLSIFWDFSVISSRKMSLKTGFTMLCPYTGWTFLVFQNHF